ncbi:MAG: methylated-DNA--[protein]-cysteine S-methyltransferase [Chloroflexi bacterium]|nr:methylated-DNA--[protein]-cysteine S-methyltransferase [Chloroflexota bacterium]
MELGTARFQPSAFAKLRSQVRAYLAGKSITIDVPLDMEGAPPFFLRAWRACQSIPRGQTRSYGWLADAAGNPRATRAAGQAMARNPLALIIPCHRVVGSDGGLGGYGGGLELKARLLGLEAGNWGSVGRPPPPRPRG